jgi:hypothetical protein
VGQSSQRLLRGRQGQSLLGPFTDHQKLPKNPGVLRHSQCPVSDRSASHHQHQCRLTSAHSHNFALDKEVQVPKTNRSHHTVQPHGPNMLCSYRTLLRRLASRPLRSMHFPHYRPQSMGGTILRQQHSILLAK